MTQVVQTQTKAIPFPTHAMQKKHVQHERFQYIHIISQQHHVIDQIQVSELTGNKQQTMPLISASYITSYA